MNYRIEKATLAMLSEITEIARSTFIHSHAHSSPEADFNSYMDSNFTVDLFKEDLQNKENIYHVLYLDDKMVGYSKINLNKGIKTVEKKNITKLGRIYLIEEVHGSGLGKIFFDFNIDLAKEKEQAGIWLFVWIHNHRAIGFYEKMGFVIVGRHDFVISETHSNPNHQMYLKFSNE